MSESEAKQIVINYPKAVEISQSALEMQQNRDYPFNQPDLFPDAIVPLHVEKGSREHALLLFYSCVLDGGRLASVVYRSMREFSSRLNITKATAGLEEVASKSGLDSIASLSREELKKLLRESFKSFGDPETSLGDPVGALYHNSRKLQEEYGGDPRNMKGASIDSTFQNILFGKDKKRKFKQYGPGKAALLMKNYVRFGMWDFPHKDIPVKVDRHLIRMSIGSGVVELPNQFTRGRIDTLVKVLTSTYQKVTSEYNLSAIDLDDAFWAIGAYNCKFNDDIFCQTSCSLKCNNRPHLDERATWYYPHTEKRKNVDNLFRYSS